MPWLGLAWPDAAGYDLVALRLVHSAWAGVAVACAGGLVRRWIERQDAQPGGLLGSVLVHG